MLYTNECVILSLDGVQLLCLIDKGLDGCRYLQTYGEWQTAAWLARATLRERDCSEVFTKWADHLASVTVNQKVGAPPFSFSPFLPPPLPISFHPSYSPVSFFRLPLSALYTHTLLKAHSIVQHYM